MRIAKIHLAFAGLSTAFLSTLAYGVSVPIQNPSFESPNAPFTVPYVVLAATDWNLSGPGPNVDLGDGNGSLNSGTGLFINSPASPAYITGGDGFQVGYLYTKTGNTFAQPLVDPSAGNAQIKYAAGTQYDFTLSVANAGSAPAPTDELLVGLYYSDGVNLHQVAQTTVMNDGTATGTSSAHFTDYSAISSLLGTGDPAVGNQIIVEFSTVGVGTNQFVVDNARLAAVPEPASLSFLGLGAVGLFGAPTTKMRVNFHGKTPRLHSR